jgi:hypothetical protein
VKRRKPKSLSREAALEQLKLINWAHLITRNSALQPDQRNELARYLLDLADDRHVLEARANRKGRPGRPRENNSRQQWIA